MYVSTCIDVYICVNIFIYIHTYIFTPIHIGFNNKAPKNPADMFRYNQKSEKTKNSRFSLMDGLYDSCANDPLKLDGTYSYIYMSINMRYILIHICICLSICMFLYIHVCLMYISFSLMDGLYDSCAYDTLKLDVMYVCMYVYIYICINVKILKYTHIYMLICICMSYVYKFFYDGWVV
jgi:hypothetical protein